MEDKVNLAGRGKVQAIRHFTDAFQHKIGPKKLECMLMVGSWSNRRLNIGLKFEKNCISNSKISFSAMLVSLHFHALLSTLKMLTN